MNGSKARCATCGASILQRTADGHSGLCRPCYRKSVAKPPESFEIPQDLVRRIMSQGGDPDAYREMVWRDGADFVHAFLNQIDAAADEYRRWSPKLRAFAAVCRRARPVPIVQSLGGSELAQYRLLRDKMSTFAESEDGLVTLARRAHHLTVLSTNQVGLAAAEELFGTSGAVILEESERSHWFDEIYQRDDQGLWWVAFAWWRIRDDIKREELERIRQRHPTLPGSSYWVVDSGVQWGPLQGGGEEEWWSWDGERAEFLETFGSYSF